MYIKKLSTQFLISFGLVVLVALVFFLSVNLIGYKVVALVLLMVVSLLAMVFDIIPVLGAAVLSAILWNFLFIPPINTFNIDTPEDVLLFMMYFVIAMVNAVLSSRIRKAETKVRERDEKAASIRLYNTLLNSLSHELRTPIATIIGATDTLKENLDRLSEEQKTDLLIELEKAGARLNRQVENLLNMSRLESGFLKPKLDWCDVPELIAGIIQANQPLQGNRNIVYHTPQDFPIFKLDRGLLEAAVQNLIQNALQYTPEGSEIIVSLINDKENCLLEISDNGPGFPEDELTNVFQKFYRLPNVPTGGSGLGLSIVKGFIEAQHGFVSLENLSDGGAKFTIKIPAEQVSSKNHE